MAGTGENQKAVTSLEGSMCLTENRIASASRWHSLTFYCLRSVSLTFTSGQTNLQQIHGPILNDPLMG